MHMKDSICGISENYGCLPRRRAQGSALPRRVRTGYSGHENSELSLLALRSLILLLALSFLATIGLCAKTRLRFRGFASRLALLAAIFRFLSTDGESSGELAGRLDALSGFSRRCQNGLAELPLAELEATFTQPLYDSESRILFSYVAQTSGDGHFFMNLVLEAATADDVELVRAYVTEHEQKGFRGMPVRFERVVAFRSRSSRGGGPGNPL